MQSIVFEFLDTLLRLKFKALLCETLTFRTVVQLSDQTKILNFSERENEDALAKKNDRFWMFNAKQLEKSEVRTCF